MVMGNGSVPHPEEDRLTQAEKNERLNQQLKVRILQELSLFLDCLESNFVCLK